MIDFTTIISLLLTLLWVYAAISKLSRIKIFKQDLKEMEFPSWIGIVLCYLLPLIEFVIALLLVFDVTRLAGMHISFVLMVVYSFYVAGAALDMYIRNPVKSGGLFKRLSWKTNYFLNMVFVFINLVGIVLMRFENIL